MPVIRRAIRNPILNPPAPFAAHSERAKRRGLLVFGDEDNFAHEYYMHQRTRTSAERAMSVKIEVSTGELIDKITILEIKRQRLTDLARRTHVEHELLLLSVVLAAEFSNQTPFLPLRQALKAVNERLWTTEDAIRDQERRQDFGAEFIRLARSIYRDNDERARLKRRINEVSGSDIIEEKSYAPY
jgi:hypothetical protein